MQGCYTRRLTHMDMAQFFQEYFQTTVVITSLTIHPQFT
jgi:hypothetical protein